MRVTRRRFCCNPGVMDELLRQDVFPTSGWWFRRGWEARGHIRLVEVAGLWGDLPASAGVKRGWSGVVHLTLTHLGQL